MRMHLVMVEPFWYLVNAGVGVGQCEHKAIGVCHDQAASARAARSRSFFQSQGSSSCTRPCGSSAMRLALRVIFCKADATVAQKIGEARPVVEEVVYALATAS